MPTDFLGFADTYEDVRPKVPMYPINVICKYLGRNPETAVDLGCGTGLSTMVWVDVFKNIIGIEPSDDMIRVAKNKNLTNTKFIQAFSNDTGLDDNCADTVVCSQSFHWMEPKSTLEDDLEKFKTVIYDIFGKSEFDIDFCYRMRVAVK